MKCPGCSQEISDAEECCSFCEFSLDDIDGLAAEAGLPRERPADDVHDPGEVLTREGRARLQDRIDRFEERVGAELRLVILPSVKPLLASEAAFWLFNRWDLGGERNLGVLLLLATRDRVVQCEVGYGLERFLSDEEAGKVLDLHAVPLLRRQAVDQAMDQSVRVIADLIELSVEEARQAAAPAAG